jgi:hypothetical protein
MRKGVVMQSLTETILMDGGNLILAALNFSLLRLSKFDIMVLLILLHKLFIQMHISTR